MCYCWSHGYKCHKGHSSMTCTNTKDGHKKEATRDDIMGGCTWNKGWKKNWRCNPAEDNNNLVNNMITNYSYQIYSGCPNPENLEPLSLIQRHHYLSCMTKRQPKLLMCKNPTKTSQFQMALQCAHKKHWNYYCLSYHQKLNDPFEWIISITTSSQ